MQSKLSKKLGLKPGNTCLIIDYWKLIEENPHKYQLQNHVIEEYDFIHFFCKTYEVLITEYPMCYKKLAKNGMLWISWPKKSSNIDSNLNRDLIREYVLENGLVDVKVAAINDDWSGLKFVYRLKDR